MFAIQQAGWVLVAPLLTAVGYFAASSAPRIGLRMITASAGLIVLLAFAFAVAVAPVTNSHSKFAFWVFTGLMLAAVIVDFAAIYAFEGIAWVHFLQMLFIPSVPWIWLVGIVVIGHEGP